MHCCSFGKWLMHSQQSSIWNLKMKPTQSAPSNRWFFPCDVFQNFVEFTLTQAKSISFDNSTICFGNWTNRNHWNHWNTFPKKSLKFKIQQTSYWIVKSSSKVMPCFVFPAFVHLQQWTERAFLRRECRWRVSIWFSLFFFNGNGWRFSIYFSTLFGTHHSNMFFLLSIRRIHFSPWISAGWASI